MNKWAAVDKKINLHFTYFEFLNLSFYMRNIFLGITAVLFLMSYSLVAQQERVGSGKRQLGHKNSNKFRQLYDEFATPNMYRTGSGAPGAAYYQQQADYKMDVEIDDINAILSGQETITYTNNSPDKLEFLWVQLDQNVREKDSKSPLIESAVVDPAEIPENFVKKYMTEPFDGGFKIASVESKDGGALPFVINQTMMRVEMPADLKPGGKFTFKIKWSYQINDHVMNRARSGYEYFKEDDNRVYVIAQFYPRMAVYNDVEGWQNSQFWGRGEFALPFGNFEVNITVPSDHMLDGTGVLTNRKEVYTKEMLARYEKAKKSYDTPVFIVTQKEAERAEKQKATTKKTWKLKATNVRDFAFATSRRFVWDMMAVKVGNKDVMAVSMYPKEGNPLWEEYSTKAVASTLKSYSRMTFEYPYHKAISVHAKNQGMEYPMICWNWGRPNPDGTYSERVKYGMISVIIHEVGHNYFPMIVNSDERQWTWMDEGLNTFLQYVAEQDFEKDYPSRRGPASKIVPYMSGDQSFIAPIMTQSNNIYQFGSNAYAKPGTALNILRETIMGRELFDYAFKTYANRWKFKHPTPEDFFRTIEDASAVDLDWFWRGWFYTTDYTDIGIKDVKKFYVSSKINKATKEFIGQRGMNENDLIPLVYIAKEGSDDFTEDLAKGNLADNSVALKSYLMDNFTEKERKKLKTPKYFYEVTFEKPGGLVMPIIVEYTYADGSKEMIKYPAQIWRKNDKEVHKVLATNKEVISIVVDPNLETADIDTTNNSWPKKPNVSEFSQFKREIKQ